MDNAPHPVGIPVVTVFGFIDLSSHGANQRHKSSSQHRCFGKLLIIEKSMLASDSFYSEQQLNVSKRRILVALDQLHVDS